MRISVDVGYVDVDVDTEDLIEDLESRGFEVLEDDDPRLKAPEFEPGEIEILIRLVESQNPVIGSELYFIREKLVRS